MLNASVYPIMGPSVYPSQVIYYNLIVLENDPVV